MTGEFHPGASLGAYRVLHELPGNTSLQEWLAEEQGSGFTRRVVLRVAAAGAEGRLREEATVLAGLEHNGIPRLYATGATAQGSYYLAREAAEGLDLLTHCNESKLSLRERLGLFLAVLDAIGFAHHHLVTHRALAPESILVTAAGEPKVLGFGTAPTEAPGSGALGRVMDLAALGFLLDRLLSGPALRPDADLMAIATRARGGDPAGQYPSVDALGEDLRRYLSHLPVVARRGGRRDRANKFFRRHRGAAAAGVAFGVLLSSGLVLALFQARAAQTAQTMAERRFEHARGLVQSLIFDVVAVVEPLPRSAEVVEKILGQALVYQERLRRDASQDPRLLRILAEGYERLGRVSSHSKTQGGGTGRRQKGREAAEQSVALWREVVALERGSAEDRAGLAAALCSLAEILGSVQLGSEEEFRATMGEALGLIRQARAEAPENLKVQTLYAGLLSRALAPWVLERLGQPELPLVDEAVRAWEPFLVDPMALSVEMGAEGIAYSATNIALALDGLNRPEEARPFALIAVQVATEGAGRMRKEQAALTLMGGYGVLGSIEARLGNFPRALAAARRVVEEKRALHANGTSDPWVTIGFLSSLSEMATLAARANAAEQAERWLDEADHLLAQNAARWDPTAVAFVARAQAESRGDAYRASAQLATSEAEQRRFLALARGSYERALDGETNAAKRSQLEALLRELR